MKIRLMATGQDYEVEQVGVVLAEADAGRASSASARSGSSSPTSRRVADAKIGDTITEIGAADARRRFPASRN